MKGAKITSLKCDVQTLFKLPLRKHELFRFQRVKIGQFLETLGYLFSSNINTIKTISSSSISKVPKASNGNKKTIGIQHEKGSFCTSLFLFVTKFFLSERLKFHDRYCKHPQSRLSSSTHILPWKLLRLSCYFHSIL